LTPAILPKTQIPKEGIFHQPVLPAAPVDLDISNGEEYFLIVTLRIG
jgi:hypothetical protein